MSVDALMDLPNTAVEDIFGRLVSYVPASTGAAVSDPTGKCKADFQERYELKQELGIAPVGAIFPALDFRTSLLDELSIAPTQGDVVTFPVRDEQRTYRVQAALPASPTSTILLLGEQS